MTMGEGAQPDDDDMLDGACDLDAEMAPETSDEDAPALVLFADTQFDDPDAVEVRRAEWVELAALQLGEGG
jgi:uncharacterized protein YciU (UPF0263 family)